MQTRMGRMIGIGILTLSAAYPQQAAQPMEPDAQRTRGEMSELFNRYPPALRSVLELDPSLLANQAYLAPYPGLVGFLNTHPEVVRNPAFYVGEAPREDKTPPATYILRDVVDGLGAFIGFGMGIGLLTWLIRTLIDSRRWSRLVKVQTDVHTKLLDRFTANEDLLAYIQSPAGAKFLESSPIMLDAGPKSVGAPLARILWSVQGGTVLIAGGIGLQIVSARFSDGAVQLHGLGVLGIALGLGFIVSAIMSYVISRRMGLIEPPAPAARTGLSGA